MSQPTQKMALYPLQIRVSSPEKPPVDPTIQGPEIEMDSGIEKERSPRSSSATPSPYRKSSNEDPAKHHRRTKIRRFDKNPGVTKHVRDETAQSIQNAIRTKIFMQNRAAGALFLTGQPGMYGLSPGPYTSNMDSSHPRTAMSATSATGSASAGTSAFPPGMVPMMFSPMNQQMVFGYMPMSTAGTPSAQPGEEEPTQSFAEDWTTSTMSATPPLMSPADFVTRTSSETLKRPSRPSLSPLVTKNQSHSSPIRRPSAGIFLSPSAYAGMQLGSPMVMGQFFPPMTPIMEGRPSISQPRLESNQWTSFFMMQQQQQQDKNMFTDKQQQRQQQQPPSSVPQTRAKKSQRAIPEPETPSKLVNFEF